jgi:hypothetical protein
MPVYKTGLHDFLGRTTEWVETKTQRKLGTFIDKESVRHSYSGYQGGQQIDVVGRSRYVFSKGVIEIDDDKAWDDSEMLSTDDDSELLPLREAAASARNAALKAKAANDKRKEEEKKVKDEEEFNRTKDSLKTAFDDILFTMEKMALKYVTDDGKVVNTKGKNIEGLLGGIVDMLRLINSALADGGYAEMCLRATGKKTAVTASKVLTFTAAKVLPYFTKANNAVTTSNGNKNNNNNNNNNKYIMEPNAGKKKQINRTIRLALGFINKIHTIIFEGSPTKQLLFKKRLFDPEYTKEDAIIESEKISDLTNNISILVKNIATFKRCIGSSLLESCAYAAGSTTATAVGTAAAAAASFASSTASSAATRARDTFGAFLRRGGKTMKKNKNSKKNTRRGKKRN